MPPWLLLAVCTVQLWQPARAQGAEYVAQDSSWKAVVQAATAGDTVKFLPGVYAGCDGVSLPSPTAPTVSGCSASRSSTARLFEGLTTMVAGKQSPNEAAACG